MLKDYVIFPALTGPLFPATLAGNALANLIRNIWAFNIIFCGHFPEDVQEFSIEETKAETRGQWYFRQVLGSANLTGGKLFHILSGNLSFQIEHHLFPDIPANRYPEIAAEVRATCEEFGLPYNTGSLRGQLGSTWKKIAKLSLPNFMTRDDDDLVVRPAPTDEERGTRAEWPRGKLKLVRTGQAHGGFEYWREDGPIDYATNRFRMSLSFRFRDRSWLRDVFSYDFRIWSLKELTEAMEEVGFASVRLLVLPRNDVDKHDHSDTDSDISDEVAAMFLRTEREEAQRRMFHTVEPGEKVFSTRSFSTYIVARRS